MRSNLCTLTLFSTLICSSQAVAAVPLDNEAGQETKQALEDVVVTATRFPEKRASVAAHISVITSKEIRNSTATNVPDLLRSQAGVSVTDITGNGRSFAVDLRGFGETSVSNTLVLVDGRRINQADLGGTDWLQIPMERVEKIEIIRGGGVGVLYGDNASGGVINIITRGGGQSQVEGNMATGSYGAVKTHLGFSAIRDKLFYTLSAGYRAANGYRDNSATNARDVGIKLTYDWNDDFILNFSAGYQKDDVGLPGYLGETELSNGKSRHATNSPADFVKTEDYFFHGGPEFHFGEGNLLAMDMSFRRRDTGFNYVKWPSTFQTATDTWSLAPKAQFSQQIGPFLDKLTLGLDYQSDVLDVHMEPQASDFILEKDTIGYYLHNELRWPANWTLTSGYRVDKTRFKFAPGPPDQTTLDADAFSVGINYDLKNRGKVYFNFSRSFRYPLLDEQFYYGGMINTDMLPQQTDEFQIGLHYKLSKSMKGDISLSRSNTDNEIYNNIELYPSNLNMDGQVRRDRLELSLEKQFEKWNWRGHYTWTEATIRSGTFADNDFPSVPKHKTGMTLGFSPTDELTMTLNGNFVGTQRFNSDFDNNFDKQPSCLTLDTSLRYRWPKVTGFFNVTNLTGTEYSEYGVVGYNPWPTIERVYYPSPGRQFMAGISANF